jgi:hypothetical protein
VLGPATLLNSSLPESPVHQQIGSATSENDTENHMHRVPAVILFLFCGSILIASPTERVTGSAGQSKGAAGKAQPKDPYPDEQPLSAVLEGALREDLTNLWLVQKSVGTELAKADFAAYVDTVSAEVSPHLKTLAVAQKERFSALIGSIGGPFLYRSAVSARPIPLLAAKADGVLGVIVASLAVNVGLSTMRVDARGRAAEAIRRRGIPSLRAFSELDIPALQFYGVIISYQQNAFGPSASSVTPESVALVVKRDLCLKFVETQITEDELFQSASIYVIDSITLIRRRTAARFTKHQPCRFRPANGRRV